MPPPTRILPTNLLVLLTAAGCNYFMGVPCSDDVMLNYQSHQLPRRRQHAADCLACVPRRSFAAWMERWSGTELLKLAEPVLREWRNPNDEWRMKSTTLVWPVSLSRFVRGPPARILVEREPGRAMEWIPNWNYGGTTRQRWTRSRAELDIVRDCSPELVAEKETVSRPDAGGEQARISSAAGFGAEALGRGPRADCRPLARHDAMCSLSSGTGFRRRAVENSSAIATSGVGKCDSAAGAGSWAKPSPFATAALDC